MRSFSFLFLIAACWAMNAANALTIMGSLLITAVVTASCALGSINFVAFGNYSPADVSPKDAQGSIRVTCPQNVNYNVGLSAGTGAGAVATNPRVMTGTPSGTLNYGLYQDTQRAVVWGNTVGTNTVVGIGGNSNPIPVYGRIPPGQNVPLATFADTIMVIVTF